MRLKMKKNKSNLPVIKNSNFRTKVRKAIFILLSSLRITTSIAPTTYANEKTDFKETIDNNRKEFLSQFKVDVSKNNVKIVDEIEKNREQEYSIATGNGEKVKEVLVNTLDKIDENFDRNASKKGKLAAFNKEEFKQRYVSLINELDDIVYVEKDDSPNQYTEYFNKDSIFGGAPVACYVNKEITNDLGKIPSNIVIMKEGQDLEYIFVHELTHEDQNAYKNKIYINYKDIISMLREGHSNNMAEYVRDTKLVGTNDSITHNSLTAYDIPTMVYNKLSYLVGTKQMDEYMQNSDKDSLNNFLSEKLDSKYGQGTGENLYKYITNLSFWFKNYSGGITEEKIEGFYEKLDEKNRIVEERKKENGQSDIFTSISNIHNNFEEMLNNIYNKETKTIDKKSMKKELHKQLKEIEMLSLRCVNKDIESINNKNDVIDYVQLWDYYRNRCAISKYYSIAEEEPLLSDNFKELKDTQKRLYKKCKQYKALNITDEKIFNKMIESQLYNVNNATISYNKNKTKLIISDEYIINKFEIETNKDGDKKYYLVNEYENDKGTVKGNKILARRELDKERE